MRIFDFECCDDARTTTIEIGEWFFGLTGGGYCESEFNYHDFVSVLRTITRFGGKR
jgi:hypothetical protein